MATTTFEIQVKGKAVKVPSTLIEGRMVVVLGKWMRMASVHDEEWVEGDVVDAPEIFVRQLKTKGVKADIFTFTQKIPDTSAKYEYPMEWDNAAAIPIGTFKDWWENRLSQVSRKNVRRAGKRGVVVRPVQFDDELLRGIVELFDETLVKQGMPFAHHGKDFDTVKKEHSTMLDRSEFIGAYHESELIGFIKMVYMGKIASILNINSKDCHYDKRPANALIAKAVEICEQKRITHLLYGKFTYGNKTNSSLREFKQRNGFEEMRFPRYYVPLTFKGRLVLKFKLHRGLIGILPASVTAFLLKSRSLLVRWVTLLTKQPKSAGMGAKDIPQGESENGNA